MYVGVFVQCQIQTEERRKGTTEGFLFRLRICNKFGNQFIPAHWGSLTFKDNSNLRRLH